MVRNRAVNLGRTASFHNFSHCTVIFQQTAKFSMLTQRFSRDVSTCAMYAGSDIMIIIQA